MFRYIAVVWNRDSATQTAVADRLCSRLHAMGAHWECAVKDSGVRVYHTGARPGSTEAHVLPEGAGVVLGTIFKAPRVSGTVTTCARASFDAHACALVRRTQGRELVREYWGNYVAVLHDAESACVRILRGPMSPLPCLYVTHEQVHVFFSFMGDCIDLGLERCSINWDYVALRIFVKPTLQETGLREVSQVQSGECVELSRTGKVSRIYWSALEIAQSHVIEHAEEAATLLRQTTKACVHALASCYDSIILYRSGGLDSSIVAACLSDAETRPRVTCLTQYSEGADSDERRYARLAIGGAQWCTHIEQRRNPSVRLESMLQASWSATPEVHVRRVELARAEAELARQCNARAIFSGGGGDELFFQSQAHLCAADFVRRHGLRPALFRIAYDAAQIEGLSLWSILRRALRAGVLPRQHDPLPYVLPYRTLASAKALEMIRTRRGSAAPWIQSTRHAPPGKLWHIFDLWALPEYYDPMGQPDDPEHVAPLLSQPLVELCLRIPTYVLMLNGWDRGLARHAFRNEVPYEILQRHSKGGMGEHMREILRANLPTAREWLRGGVLAQQGLINTGETSEALGGMPSSVVKGTAEIFILLGIEAWTRQWTTQARRAAA